MALVAGVNYDPGTAVSIDTASATTAMTAFDTTNLRLAFNVPVSGKVLVRMACVSFGAAAPPQLLLGVLESSTIISRQSTFGAAKGGGGTTNHWPHIASFIVTGLTPGASKTWDAAYAVQSVSASTNIKYGGPDDTTTQNAWGAIKFEVWDAANLITGVNYDPGTAASIATSSLSAMTAIDTTNLRLTFNAPASGNVLVRIRSQIHGATSPAQVLYGVMSGSSILSRASPFGTLSWSNAAGLFTQEAIMLIKGLTPGASQTWDAARSVENAVASSAIKWGGPNDASGNDAFGGFTFEVWKA